ncbi:hypothetical protein [Janthinobacterium fluminis]|uniref:Uncharacterized protein n=1 Tax=Janthinobacterium fluminis TaxID=2987524 RepID=A0ABT5JWI7_9BURK|nr:hypothetical protein [Janthinobacterium fluminis]MDC8757103.1 hypothetical protein [Janthinobacterium fluminis]
MITALAPLASPIVPAAPPAKAYSGATNLVPLALGLSSDASVVATLGAGVTDLSLYTPQGLLDTLEQAGAAPPPFAIPDAGSDVAAIVQNALNQAVLGTAPDGSSVAAGIYTSSGVVASLESDTVATDWATILKDHPASAGIVVAASFAQGILSTLQTTA